jgi:ABC-type sugar transport system ATPase subunit
MRVRAREVLERVGAAHIDVDAEFGSLRTADQQAVEIAKSLRQGMRLLLLDEPTSSLTRHEAAALFMLVRQLRAAGVGVIFVTHRLEEALDLCDRLVVLRDGRLAGNRAARDWTRDDLIEAMAGRRLEAGRHAATARTDQRTPYLRLEGVGDGGLVRGVTFDLAQGEILGLFGLVGAGRTEILEMLAGARSIADGAVTLGGSPYRPGSPSAMAARGVAYLPEGRKANGILPNRPVRENLTISVLRWLSSAGVIRRAAERRQVDEDIRALGIVAQSPEQPIRYLSGGNQQKALLARALATKPSVLLLDEPTHGVDVRTKEQIYGLLRQLAGQGMAIVLASSEMAEVMALADRILVMSNGRPVAVHERTGFDELALMRDAFRFLETHRAVSA